MSHVASESATLDTAMASRPVVTRVDVALLPPTHGWLPVRFGLDDFVIDARASNVMNDPIDGLLDLLGFALAPRSIGPCLWLWLEPAGFAIETFGETTEHVTLRVLHAEECFPGRTRDGMAVRFECDVRASSLAEALRRALKTLFQSPTADALNRWRRGETRESYRARFERALGRAG
jgi:hypothetical protein